MSMTDAELVTRILGGEDLLFGELVQRYSGCVWAICSGHIFNRSDCEEVAQDVFAQCYLRLDTVRKPTAFGRWLSQLARRQCLNWLRAAARRRAAMTRYEEHAQAERDANATTIEDQLVREEVRETLYKVVQTLPPKTREAMLLCYSEGYSVAEAASLLDISPDALKKRLQYGRQMLHARIGSELEPALAERKHSKGFTQAALAAVPFGQAAWCAKGAGTATGAAESIGLIGAIVMSTKSVASVIVVFVAILLALLLWKPWTRETSRTPGQPMVVSQTTPAEQVVESEVESTSAARTVTRAADGAPEAIEEEPTPSESPEYPRATTASISGYVMDEEGFALDGASVYIEIYRGAVHADVAKAYQATTDSDGAYEIAGIDAFGDATLYAGAEGYLMERSHLSGVKEQTQREGVNFMLTRAAFSVAGRVISEQGVGIPGATVGTPHYGYGEEGSGDYISGMKFVFAVTDAQGRFDLAIPGKGLADFTVTADGYAPGFFPEVPTGARNLEFVLNSGGAIAGVITDAEGNPLEGVRIEVVGEAYPRGLPTGGQSFSAQPLVVYTDASGNYVAESLGEEYVYTVTVPDEESEENREVTEEKGVRYITGMLRTIAAANYGGQPIVAQKRGIHVRAGETVVGIDFVLGAATSATIYGTVTDRTTGEPVCPVTVGAAVVYPEGETGDPLGGLAVTDLDGSYTLQVSGLTGTHTFRVWYHYFTQGGNAWGPPSDSELAILELEPGDEEQLDFTTDAPLTVPIRFVDGDATPVEGIMAGVRQAGGSGACGGLVSDAEGRVTLNGIPPRLTYEVVAWETRASGITTAGVSEPFTGEPGETVPEVVVECYVIGGVEGVVTNAQGNPVSNVHLGWWTVDRDGTVTPVPGTNLDANGAFSKPDAFREGVYPKMILAYRDSETGQLNYIIVSNIEIAAGDVTDLGVLRFQPMSDKDFAVIIQAQ